MTETDCAKFQTDVGLENCEDQKSFLVAVCASGGGGNFQSLIDAREEINFSINCLIVDRECGAIGRAERMGIPVKRINQNHDGDLDKAIPANTDLVVLAGFMPIVPESLCEKWGGRMINTHPSLLPKYGGKGMYGVKVQEAVMAAGEKRAGCTVHFVSSVIDGGNILLQKAIDVDYNETPWQLGERIFIEENKLLVEAVRLFRTGKHLRLRDEMGKTRRHL